MQPVFVLAFVELDADQERVLEAPVKRIREQTEFLSPRELKFSSLKGSPKGHRAIREVGEALVDAGARAYFSLIEKRFFAPVLVLETLADASLNPAAPDASRDAGHRRWLTNIMYEAIGDDLLFDFFHAAKEGDEADIRAIGAQLIARLRLHPDDRVVLACELLQAGLEEPWSFAQEDNGPPFPNPVMFAFTNLLLAADELLGNDDRRANVVGDVDKEFGPVLSRALRMARDESNFPNGLSAYGMPGPIRNIDRRIEVASHESLGVQMADLMAGVVRWVAVETSKNIEVLPDQAATWEPFRALAARGWSWWQASERFLSALRPTFHGLLPPLDPT